MGRFSIVRAENTKVLDVFDMISWLLPNSFMGELKKLNNSVHIFETINAVLTLVSLTV